MKNLLLFFLVLPLFVLHPLTAAGPEPAASEEGGANETFDLRFPGGTLWELVQQIREQADRPPPLILGKGADLVEIAPMELLGGTVEQIYEALLMYLRHSVDRSAGVTFDTYSGVWIVNAAPRPPEELPQPEVDTRIFQVGSFLADFALEDLTTAIETSWEMANVQEEDVGRLRFHEETKLLFVRGNPQQVALVEEVLSQMGRELAGLRERRQARELMEARVEARLEAVQRELEADEVWLERMRESRSEKGQVEFHRKSVEDLAQARDRLLEMRERLGDGHPALEEYLVTMEKQRERVAGQRSGTTRLMDANDR